MSEPNLSDLMQEYDRALSYTDELWRDLTVDEVHWREGAEASGIGWHLGHQPAVAHYLVRNLTAAEPRVDPELDALMDSATPPSERGELPDLDRLSAYRTTVAQRVRVRVGDIERGEVGAPDQLRRIASTMMVAIINHEYQHDKWIGEVRHDVHGRPLPIAPVSDHLIEVDGYVMVR